MKSLVLGVAVLLSVTAFAKEIEESDYPVD